MNPEVKKYVDAARLAGKPDAQIAQDLRGGGWSEAEISAGITGIPSAAVSGSGKGTKVSSILIAIVAMLFLPSLIMQGIYRASYNSDITEPVMLPTLPPEDKEEAFIRSYIYGFRANAETYYKSNKNSYKDMCNAKTDPLAKVYADLRATPNVEIKCDSSQYEYNLSVTSGAGKFWCTNNLGFVTETYKNDVNAVCE